MKILLFRAQQLKVVTAAVAALEYVSSSIWLFQDLVAHSKGTPAPHLKSFCELKALAGKGKHT